MSTNCRLLQVVDRQFGHGFLQRKQGENGSIIYLSILSSQSNKHVCFLMHFVHERNRDNSHRALLKPKTAGQTGQNGPTLEIIDVLLSNWTIKTV